MEVVVWGLESGYHHSSMEGEPSLHPSWRGRELPPDGVGLWNGDLGLDPSSAAPHCVTRASLHLCEPQSPVSNMAAVLP